MLLANVIRKMIAEDFVQYKDGNFVARGNVIGAPTGGGDGSAFIPRIAYASDPNGTGFTLTHDTALEYTAITVLPLDTTPSASHFAGFWYHRKGLPGAPGTDAAGTNGEPGGFRMNMSTLVAAEKPGTGKIRFNHTDISQATEMYIDEMIPSGVDLSATWSILELGWHFILKPATNFNTPFAVIKVTGDIVNNGDWFTLPIDALSMSNETFADADKLVIQLFGGGGGSAAITEAAIRAAGNFPLLVSNGAGGYKLLDNANVEVKSASQVFKLPSITITGVSNLPAANTFPHGTVVKLHQDNLVGEGANALGVEIEADAVNNIWRPHGPQILFWKNFGSSASPTLSLSAAGIFNLGAAGSPVIPAGLLHSKAKVDFFMRLNKVGATAPQFRVWLGTDLAAHDNNSVIYQQTATVTADLDIPGKSEVTFLTTTTAICTNRAVTGGGGGADTLSDAATLLNTAAAMKATFAAQTLSGDTAHLIEMGIVWRY